jgi:dolichol kinase
VTAPVAVWRHEVGRKAVHLAMTAFPVWILLVPPPWSSRGPVLAFLFLLTLDAIRLASARVHGWFEHRIGAYLRPHESRTLISMHYLTAAAAFLASVTPPAVAAAAMTDLVLGDAAAALVGRRWGQHRYGEKSVEGSLACFAVCWLATALLVPGRTVAVLASACVATLLEARPLGLDDNLAMPLGAAAVLVWWP